MNVLEIISMIFSIVGLIIVVRGYQFARKGSREAFKMYTFGFLALAGGDVISGFRHGLSDPDIIELILAAVFFYFSYKEWKNYKGL